MNALFIWNKESVWFMKEYLEKTNQFQKENCKFITSQNEFDQFQRDYFERKEIGKNKQLKELYNRFYICVELGWNNDNFLGYKNALEILKNWRENNVGPRLVFISMLNRDLLFTKVTGKYQYMVKVFDHLDILNIQNSKLPVATTPITKWNFFKNYVLTSAGILDDISHKLTGILYEENKSISLKNTIDNIKGQESLVGTEILNFINSDIPQNNNELTHFIKQLRDLIEERIHVYKPHSPKKIEINPNIKVMVIEDNVGHLKIIQNSLQRYFELDKTLFCFTDGLKAQKELRENADDYNLVLIDLELLNGNYYQDVQGIDIFETLKSHPKVSFRIITGLGRKGVKELLKIPNEYIISKKQLYHFDTDEEIDRLLEKMIKEFSVKEQKFHMEFGPNKGIFKWPGFKTLLSNYWEDEKLLNEWWKHAFDILEKFRRIELNPEDWGEHGKSIPSPKTKETSDYEEFIVNGFKTLLAHRLIHLYLASQYSFKITLDEAHYELYADQLNRNGIKLNYSHLQKICLNTEVIEDKYQYKLAKENLFPQEIEYLEKLEKNENAESNSSKILIKNNSNSIFQLIETYFDLEDEQYQLLNLPSNLDNWSYQDLKNCWALMFDDVLTHKTDSNWYFILKSFVESAQITKTIQTQLEIHIPNISKQIDLMFSMD